MLFLQGQPADEATLDINSMPEIQIIEHENSPPIYGEESEERYIEQEFIEYELPDTKLDTSFKAYMDYRTITDETSDQWKLQQIAYTDENGFRRINDDYLVAMGTYYSEKCGSRFRVILDSNVDFTVTVADIKDPNQTDSLNMYHSVNETMANVLEFVVDTDVLCSSAILLGSVSCLGLEGNIIKIERLD